MDPGTAYREGWRVRLWDFLFYASFGVVVASSVRVGGVLLVFSYLIVPALAGIAVGGTVSTRLLVGWAFGTGVSLVGMLASALLDLPTGATVASMFGRAGADGMGALASGGRDANTLPLRTASIPAVSATAANPAAAPTKKNFFSLDVICSSPSRARIEARR